MLVFFSCKREQHQRQDLKNEQCPFTHTPPAHTDPLGRVLPRETPAPPWRATGRFVQQTITAIGAGWGSGGGSGGGHGWSLLALEALALTEYEEVVVLDQKVHVF